MQVVIDDSTSCPYPLCGKVEAGERLSFDDGLALYRTSDILALGYLAKPGARAAPRATSPFST